MSAGWLQRLKRASLFPVWAVARPHPCRHRSQKDLAPAVSCAPPTSIPANKCTLTCVLARSPGLPASILSTSASLVERTVSYERQTSETAILRREQILERKIESQMDDDWLSQVLLLSPAPSTLTPEP